MGGVGRTAHRGAEGGLVTRIIQAGINHELTEYTCCIVRVMTEDMACTCQATEAAGQKKTDL